MSLQPVRPVEAAPLWTAYNDTNTTTGTVPGANVTTYTIPSAGTATGLLRNFATGANLGVTVTITTSGGPGLDTNGVTPNAGTDAYNTFNGIIDLAGGIWYGSSGWYVDVTFTGLDPASTYTFATTNNRNNNTYTDRYTKFTIRDITTATNASTSGATVSTTTLPNDTVSFWSYNTVNGYVARWTAIQPGADGDFNVRYESNFTNSDYRAYGPSGFMLQQDTTDPTITTTGTLTPFTAIPGTPSAEQSYTVSGINLTTPIVITPPTDFEISLTSGSGFSSTPISLTPTGGAVATTTIYVRFTRASSGTSSGNITHTSAGATAVNVAVSGTASLCSVVQLTAAEDTYVSVANVTYNNGSNVEIHVNGTTGTARRGALLRWDLSSIPSNATVSAASLILTCIDVSPLQFNLYNMRRTWVEGTSSQTASSTSANWNTYDGTNSWGTVGIASTTLDRYSTNLWSATTTSFTATGSRTEALNSSGVGVVQGWIDGSLSNYGLTMQNYAGTTDNAVYFSSSEVTTAANRPRLNVSYCVPDPRPTATVTFQYGASGYSGTVDTYLRGTTEGDTNFSSQTDLQWDDNTDATTDEIALIRFDNLFNSQGGPIPNGATITSASLTYMTTDLNSGSTANGDPANVYESLVAWTGTTATYNNFGGEAGVQADEYRATPVVSAPAGALSTSFTINVTASLQRWSTTPAENLGWIFLPTNQDGVNIYSSDFATVAYHPQLSVTYQLPTTAVTFQNGVSGYAGTVDTYLRGTTEGDTNFSSQTDLQWDDNTDATTDEIALIRFDNLFNSQGGPIPDGVTITSASLTYMTTDLNSGSTANGDPANVYESLVDWPVSTVTYNNFGGEAGVQTEEYRATPVVSAPATALSTVFTISVTPSLQRWTTTPAENLGWIFLPTNQDGVNIYSSEFATVSYRPQLSVTYVTPSTCYALTLSHTGNGTTPTATPGNSNGCTAGTYLAGANISLSGAVPDSGWSISGWTGTSNNSSTGSTNSLVMPAANHAASVIYTEIPPTCYALTLSHTGNGTTPTASPANSSGCAAGNYVSGETIALSGAVPSSGWAISGWTGTINNASTASTNSVLAVLALLMVPVQPEMAQQPPAQGDAFAGDVITCGTSARPSGWCRSGVAEGQGVASGGDFGINDRGSVICGRHHQGVGAACCAPVVVHGQPEMDQPLSGTAPLTAARWSPPWSIKIPRCGHRRCGAQVWLSVRAWPVEGVTYVTLNCRRYDTVGKFAGTKY